MLKKIRLSKISAAVLTLLIACNITVVSYAVPITYEEAMRLQKEKEESKEEIPFSIDELEEMYNSLSDNDMNIKEQTVKVEELPEDYKEIVEAYTETGFDDVLPDAWYSKSVKYVSSKKIMSGFPDGEFKPDNYITRGMFATIMYNITDNKAVDAMTTFDDIDEDEYYFKPVMWAYSRALTDGVNEFKFSPDDYITREQLISMLYRLARYNSYDNVDIEKTDSLKEFSDCEEISSYALIPVEWAKDSELIQGRTDGTFSPNEYVTRAEAAVIIERYMKKFNS